MTKNHYNIAVLPGDGIGPEVMAEAIRVLQAIAEKTALQMELHYADVGAAALEKYDDPLPHATLELCKNSDAVLLGAIGHPRWDNMPPEKRPERGLLGLREELGLYANLRPVKLFPSLADASSLKREVIEGIDILIIRELTGGLYFGNPRGIDEQNGGRCYNTMVYSKTEVERIARVAFQAAQKRCKKVMSVDKANVLEVSQFWRRIVIEVAKDFPDVRLDHLYVDNCAMQLVRWPKQFDVILTENLFGDILSDEAAMLTGSLGMLPSASLGARAALYEPVHGSAPDIAGKNVANPIAAISSATMMLRHSMALNKEADIVDQAINQILEKGYRTKDIAGASSKINTTQEMGQLIADRVKKLL